MRYVTEHSTDLLPEFFIELLFGILVISKTLLNGRGGVARPQNWTFGGCLRDISEIGLELFAVEGGRSGKYHKGL